MLHRAVIAVVISLFATPLRAEPCHVSPGADYTFERAFATRRVNDAHDHGTIRLAAYIYRPVKVDKHAVVVFSHGSTGNFQFDPAEPQPVVQCSLKNYFLSRGYALVVYTRRGRGESTGRYVEECSRFRDAACTPAKTRAISGAAFDSAMADGRAVIDQLALGRVARPGDRLILAGHSRGGMLSLALANAYPHRTKAVLNFAGGWLGAQSDAAENAARADWHGQRFRNLGVDAAARSLWIYGEGDPLYDLGTTRRFFDAYANRTAEWLALRAHNLENAHLIVQEGPLWAAAADRFLDAALSVP